ncbi:MAG: bifunctional diaminohydroxyphosphoribosylaminopyrimidine deaminase/5-amino-6-(5-phosphoribosylamino)uracil reductase RibD [Planctomycetota bacterium]
MSQSFDAADERFMWEAIDLARQGEGYVEPNPMVGCVIVEDGEIIGKGFHERYGGPHAEVNGLADAGSDRDLSNATIYVTLEPCCHTGKTPPCTRAIIRSGIRKVVVACEDPSDKVAGKGIQALRADGISVSVGVLETEAQDLIRPFIKVVTQGLPYVIAKWAMSIDGAIATSTGESQWISGPESRLKAHQLRSRVDAIVVGHGTLRHDDPSLTTRLPDGQTCPRQARRVVMVRQSLPESRHRVFHAADAEPAIVLAPDSLPEASEGSSTDSFELHQVDTTSETFERSTLRKLASLNCTNVMIEGGGKLLGQFFDQDLVDEIHVYMGPKIIGSVKAIRPVGGVGNINLVDCELYDLLEVSRLGSDIFARYGRIRSPKESS